jgi:hypothetical protein
LPNDEKGIEAIVLSFGNGRQQEIQKRISRTTTAHHKLGTLRGPTELIDKLNSRTARYIGTTNRLTSWLFTATRNFRIIEE